VIGQLPFINSSYGIFCANIINFSSKYLIIITIILFLMEVGVKMKPNKFINWTGKDDSQTLDFITRNVITPEWRPSSEKEVNLENMMIHLGGTKGEIDHLSHIGMMKKKRL
jgi:hypothetical protein